MTEAIDQVRVGDKIRISVPLLQDIHDAPGHRSPVVTVVAITQDDEGALILTVKKQAQ